MERNPEFKTSPKKRFIFYIYLTLYINYNIKIFFTQVLRVYVIKNKKCCKILHKNARFFKKFLFFFNFSPLRRKFSMKNINLVPETRNKRKIRRKCNKNRAYVGIITRFSQFYTQKPANNRQNAAFRLRHTRSQRCGAPNRTFTHIRCAAANRQFVLIRCAPADMQKPPRRAVLLRESTLSKNK